jgi:hypothetical protein
MQAVCKEDPEGCQGQGRYGQGVVRSDRGQQRLEEGQKGADEINRYFGISLEIQNNVMKAQSKLSLPGINNCKLNCIAQ